MKISLLIVSFVALLIAACSAPTLPLPVSVTAPATQTNLPTTNPSGPAVPSQSTLQSTRIIQAIASATVPPTFAIPGSSPSSRLAARLGATSTVASSGIIGSMKMYVNAKLQIVLDYPADWSVLETTNGASFISPQGASIDLSELNASNPDLRKFEPDEDLPNTRCTNSTNLYKSEIRKCLDTIARSYVASITLKLAAGGTRVIALSTRAKGSDSVFDALLASARLTP